jgi:hypothetical protein
VNTTARVSRYTRTCMLTLATTVVPKRRPLALVSRPREWHAVRCNPGCSHRAALPRIPARRSRSRLAMRACRQTRCQPTAAPPRGEAGEPDRAHVRAFERRWLDMPFQAKAEMCLLCPLCVCVCVFVRLCVCACVCSACALTSRASTLGHAHTIDVLSVSTASSSADISTACASAPRHSTNERGFAGTRAAASRSPIPPP